MTSGGGTALQGIVYSVTPGGTETVLHSFTGIPDGAQPLGGLIDVAGTLYGMTNVGGARGNGTIFSITTSGKEKVLYSFGTAVNDGINPQGDLLYSGGAFYGTTGGGGSDRLWDGLQVRSYREKNGQRNGDLQLCRRFGRLRPAIRPD